MHTLGILSLAMTAAVGAAPAWAAPSRAASASAAAPDHDTIIRNGVIYDGSGKPAFAGDVTIDRDRVSYVGPHAPGHARTEFDAHGRAVAPGFINMLAHPEESLLVDGRALSDLRQGVTLEVMGELSMGPINEKMKAFMRRMQGDVHFDVDWTTLGQYLTKLEQRGIAPNIASFVSAGTVREVVLGEEDVQPDAAQLAEMRRLVKQAMEEGALGVTTALIYNPFTYARTDELTALASESGRCGGMYIAHMRSEGDRFLEAIDETIAIAKGSGAPAEIYHLKVAAKSNWGKLTALPASNLSLTGRGMLRKGYYADIVVFDPKTIQDHSTYEKPHQLATGVDDVWINGVQALKDGEATRQWSGRVVRGRAWTGAPHGGCRASSQDWTWNP
jgi:N-acyl-D-amino-acid deacylase